jgi:type I protein arginine methyltransferase
LSTTPNDPSAAPQESCAAALVPVDPQWIALHTVHYQFLANQQLMLEDDLRVDAYHAGIVGNKADFEGRTVMDVGAGTGLLSLFAAHAGARKVYAVEASGSADYAQRLIEHAGLGNCVEVVRSTLQALDLSEKVDIVISEPWGFFLFHERMVEAFVEAKERFLAPNGRMFPSAATLVIAPFTDAQLYEARLAKVHFWDNKAFYGIDLSGLSRTARDELFSMPALGPFDSSMLMAAPATKDFNFVQMTMGDLAEIELPFRFAMAHGGAINGIAGWFDLAFDGSTNRVVLSTAPDVPNTHWWQLRFVFPQPLMTRIGQVFSGRMILCANRAASYTVHVEGRIEGGGLAMHCDFQMQAHFWWSPE